MSLLGEITRYGRDLMVLSERVETLLKERADTLTRLEDHEKRLIRIETLIELAQVRRPPIRRS